MAVTERTPINPTLMQALAATDTSLRSFRQSIFPITEGDQADGFGHTYVVSERIQRPGFISDITVLAGAREVAVNDTGTRIVISQRYNGRLNGNSISRSQRVWDEVLVVADQDQEGIEVSLGSVTLVPGTPDTTAFMERIPVEGARRRLPTDASPEQITATIKSLQDEHGMQPQPRQEFPAEY